MTGILFLAGCHHNQQTAYTPPPPIPATKPETARQTPPPKPENLPDAHAPVLATETGIATWYGPSTRHTADGEPYTGMEMTAAHRTLPLNSVIRVTNLATGQSAIVRVNDRGPFVRGRVLDLSIAAARATGVYRAGASKVRIDVLSYPPNFDKAGHWCVQIGAFADQSDAITLKQQLLHRYNAAKVIEFPGDTGYWVRFTPPDLDRQHALQAASTMHTKEPSVDAFLVRLD